MLSSSLRSTRTEKNISRCIWLTRTTAPGGNTIGHFTSSQTWISSPTKSTQHLKGKNLISLTVQQAQMAPIGGREWKTENKGNMSDPNSLVLLFMISVSVFLTLSLQTVTHQCEWQGELESWWGESNSYWQAGYNRSLCLKRWKAESRSWHGCPSTPWSGSSPTWSLASPWASPSYHRWNQIHLNHTKCCKGQSFSWFLVSQIYRYLYIFHSNCKMWCLRVLPMR